MLTNVRYVLFRSGCKLAALLPFWFLYYSLANFIYFIVYHVVGYRVAVTRDNLKNSFPLMSDQERMTIEKKFYRQLAEIIVDTITLPDISVKNISKRMVFTNLDQYKDIIDKQSWICALAHYGSWEYTVSYALKTQHILMPVYRPLYDHAVDKLMYNSRSKFGAQPIAMQDVAKKIFELRKTDNKFILALLADQTPPHFERKYWYTFLNQDTIFFQGMGKFAVKFDLPVLFLNIKKIKRGYYQGTLEMLYEPCEHLEDHEIVERYAMRLEKMIRERPELWMWSHRRWKHHK